jgi:indolepyruvate ferredoxin oxidoreductase alpha subunit
VPTLPLGDLAARPPQLCKGCPHADSFRAIVEAAAPLGDAYMFSDIGCYALGVAPPFRAVHSCVDMGASISMAHGAAQAGAHPVICTIGDSTFAHSGMTPLLGAAHADANMTVFILDNATVGMTGAQESMACGEALDPSRARAGRPPRSSARDRAAGRSTTRPTSLSSGAKSSTAA